LYKTPRRLRNVSKGRQPTYSQALSELEKIIGEIESEGIDLDTLTEKVKKAATLVKFCRSRLRSTEEEVKKALTEVEDTAEQEGTAGGESKRE
jgi:exodeoxyribonuclease VII small subunit